MGRRIWIPLEFGKHVCDGCVKLRITTVHHKGWIVDHLDVGIDAVALYAPGSICLLEGNRRSGNPPAVDQGGVARDADQPSPCPHADQLP